MHDADGLVGLWVCNRPGGIEANRTTWRAFGDGYLRAKDLQGPQTNLIKSTGTGSNIVITGNMGKVDTNPDANFEQAAAAVGSAFKQLHYQAHAAAYPDPTKQTCRPSPLQPVGLPFDTSSGRRSTPTPPVSTPIETSEPADATLPAPYIKAILDFNGPVGSDPSKATQLKNEDLAPGMAGGGTLWPNVHLSTSERIAFMKTLLPIPYEPRETGTFSEFANIPPLFSKDLKLNLSRTYTVEKGADTWWPKSSYRRHSHYRGFTLNMHWGGTSDPLPFNYDKYFYMMRFFSDVEGLDGYVDKSLLDVYEKLPEE
ncbi:MAG: hypothetical protein ACJ746_01060 [Bryobacteraceae bacterium]